MSVVFNVLYMVCPIAALTFIARLVCAPFFTKVSDEIRRHPVVHLIWGGLGFLGVLLFLGVLDPASWPSPSVERRGQRQKVLDRVQTVGGWSAVRLGCEALVTNHPDGLIWLPPRSNAWVYPNPQTQPHKYYVTNVDDGPLPPAVAVLKPQEVRYYPPRRLREFKDESQVAVVRIKVFGMHSTGGHSTPYYGLEVPCGAGAESYEPRPSQGGVSGNRYTSFRKVADGVFEVY
jgi:hypothetical protein